MTFILSQAFNAVFGFNIPWCETKNNNGQYDQLKKSSKKQNKNPNK